MRGVFGGCDGFGGAVESQRGGTLHIHLIAYIISAFQHSTLAQITELLEAKLMSVAALERYLEWVSMHEQLDQSLHNKNVDDLEKQWPTYKSSAHDALGFVPQLVFRDEGATRWHGADSPTALADALDYMKKYQSSGQFVLSRTNHHFHPKDKKTGQRVPLSACVAKGQRRKKTKECKHGFPFDKQITTQTKLVCKEVAKTHHLKTSGQRNALGSFLIKRSDEWLS